MVDETKYLKKIDYLPIFFLYFIFFKQLVYCHFFGQNTHPHIHRTPSSQPIFFTTKNAKETKIQYSKRYFTQAPPIRCFFYITRPFSPFLLISLLISSALLRRIERLFLKKEPQQHKDVSILTFFVQMGCT